MFLTGWEIAGMRSRQTKETAAVAYEAGNWGARLWRGGNPAHRQCNLCGVGAVRCTLCRGSVREGALSDLRLRIREREYRADSRCIKKHQAPATFFVVGHFLESAPEIAKRMVAEGHTVGNHTYHHPDMSSIADLTAFQKEMDDNAALFSEVTGQKMANYYRPPQGKYSTKNLEMAKQLGYHTFFWSLAYVDWNVDAQPTKEEAFEKLLGRIHPGAIVLLHSTSKTNGEILDELLTKWEEMGYTFHPLSELCEK